MLFFPRLHDVHQRNDRNLVFLAIGDLNVVGRRVAEFYGLEQTFSRRGQCDRPRGRDAECNNRRLAKLRCCRFSKITLELPLLFVVRKCDMRRHGVAQMAKKPERWRLEGVQLHVSRRAEQIAKSSAILQELEAGNTAGGGVFPETQSEIERLEGADRSIGVDRRRQQEDAGLKSPARRVPANLPLKPVVSRLQPRRVRCETARLTPFMF